MADKPKIILGIDPGTLVLGYGIISVQNKTIKMITMGVIKLQKLGEMNKRLASIFRRIDSIIEEFNPDEVAIEAQFFGKDVQAMLKLGRAQGSSPGARNGPGVDERQRCRAGSCRANATRQCQLENHFL